MPPNRTFSVQPHLPFWEGLNASYCRDLSPVPPTREGYGRAYPDQVSGHNLVCSLMRLWYRVPEWECFDHDGGRGVFGRHGATQDQPVGDLGRSGRESAVAMEGFCRNAVGPPKWE